MCGIAGILHPDHEASAELVAHMVERLRHRGPDDTGLVCEDGMVLGHARLSIIDLSNSGHQPMANENNSIWVALNGEIYNYRELRNELLARGHHFRGTSDAEVVPHLYEEYDVEFVRYLRGMYGLAVWDINRRRLLLARDRVGKKPLFYAQIPDGLAFASEMKALFLVPGVEVDVRKQSICDYLVFGVVPGLHTAYKGINRVPPAHIMAWEDGRLADVKRYWDLGFLPKLRISREEAKEEILKIIREAVSIRLRSDVSVGCFLSGGIDSGLVTALASQELSSPLKTFSIYFKEEEFDERPLARQVVRRYETEHREFELKPQFHQDLEQIIGQYDEPYSAQSALPTFAVARLAGQEVKVVLNGDGGDEVFGGYRHFLAAKLFSKLRFLENGPIVSLLRGLQMRLPPPRRGRSNYQFLYRLLRTLRENGAGRYLMMTNDRFEPVEVFSLMCASGDTALSSPKNVLEALEAKTQGMGPLDSIMFKDLHFMLCDDHLVKMDIATMASALEARSPLLDQKLIEFVAVLPEEVKYPNWQTKGLLRSIAEPLLPPEVTRAPKRGFEIPLVRWMRQDLNSELLERLFDPSSYCMNHFERHFLKRVIAGKGWDPKRWANAVWTLFCLEIWWSNYKENILS